MKIKMKNQPRLRLADLLRRRKMSLTRFMSEFGITTYAELVDKSTRIGVVAPAQHEFDALGLEVVNDPMNGVIVVGPQESPDDECPPPGWQPSEEDLSRMESAPMYDPDAHMGGEQEEIAGKQILSELKKKSSRKSKKGSDV
jgi:hypothetical protein